MDTEPAEKLLDRYSTLKMKKRGIDEALDALENVENVPIEVQIKVRYKEASRSLFWANVPLDLSQGLLTALRNRLVHRINLVENLLEPMNDLAEEELEQPV